MMPRYRVLFCLATTALSGGVKMVFEIAEGLIARGHTVDLFSFAGPPRWRELAVPMLGTRDVGSVAWADYDFVFATNAYMIPLLWPLVGPARLVFYAQDYESFHHGPAGTYEDFNAETPSLQAAYRLPVPIITASQAVRRLILERTGRHVWQAPYGLTRSVFHEQPRREPQRPQRVLFVGNYLMPYKGMRDGFEAVNQLVRDLDIQVVLATQEGRDRHLFAQYSFATEIHFRPPESAMPAIFGSVDVYCCSSWYEGFGLPALEAFACGVPVVSTRTFGVDDYGVDGVNLLLADAHDPAQLAAALRRVLTEPTLAAQLRANGLETVRARYHWAEGLDRFEDALDAIARSEPASMPARDVLEALLDRLEHEGCFTPIGLFRRFRVLSDRIDRACERLLDGADSSAFASLRDVRDEIAPLLANPTAQYHAAFRAAYDACQVALAFHDDPRFSMIVARRRAANQGHASTTSSALREIRYLE